MRRCVSMFLIISILLTSSFAFAGEVAKSKSEIVYVNLDEYGKPVLINVYNKYSNVSNTEIIDYAKYSEVTNLTNYELPIVDDEVTKWSVGDQKDFSYMGVISNELASEIPWSIDISYKLNGEDKNASELLGEKGLVKIVIDVKKNDNAKEYFKNNFMLEITSSYDMTEYISVYSKDAIEVLTGNTKTLMLIVLPGQDKTFEIEIGSESFSMDGITFAMVPLKGEIFDKLSDISKDKKDLENALDSLNASMDVLLNNTASMNSANSKLVSGTKNIKAASNKLHEFAVARNQNIDDLYNDLSEFSKITSNAITDIEHLQEAVEDVNKMASDINEKLSKVIDDLGNVADALDDLEEIADRLPDDLGDMKKLVQDTRSTIKSAESVLKAQSSGQNFDTSEIEDSIKTLAALAKEYGIKAAGAEDVATAGEYLKIATTIKESLETITSEMEAIEENVSSGLSGANSLVSNLNKVEKDLGVLESNIISLTKDVKNLPDDVDSIEKSVLHINDILKIVKDNLDNYLDKKDNLTDGVNHLKDTAVELNEINLHANNVLNHVQSMTKVLDAEIYSGSIEIADGLTDLLGKTQSIANESGKIKQSKNTIYNVTKNRLDEISDETNIFEINSETKAVSFTSDKNEVPESVQILLKSKDIKAANFVSNEDIEPQEQKMSIWEKIVNVFRLIGQWLGKLFGNK